jgi:hypothetical protein
MTIDTRHAVIVEGRTHNAAHRKDSQLHVIRLFVLFVPCDVEPTQEISSVKPTIGEHHVKC